MLFRHRSGTQRRVAAVALAGSSLVIATAVGSVFLVTALDSWSAIAAAGPAGPADGILLMAGAGGGLLSLWLGLGMALSALSALPGAVGDVCRLLAGRIAPAAVRKAVAFVLGTTLTAALVPGNAVAGGGHEALPPRSTEVVATAGHKASLRAGAIPAIGSLVDAAPDASFRFLGDPVRDPNVADAAPAPGWSPDSPITSRGRPTPPAGLASSAGLTSSAAREPAAEGVVVHRGDTLWSIAARHLGPGASPADIDAEWHRWLAANRDVIGDDPNLILPGQQLRPPPSLPVGS